MGASTISLIFSCDGKLINDDINAEYVGGYKKVFDVSKNIEFREFKEKIQGIMKLSSDGIGFKIMCGLYFNENMLIAVDVDDDESLRYILERAKPIRPLRAYIIKEQPSFTSMSNQRIDGKVKCHQNNILKKLKEPGNPKTTLLQKFPQNEDLKGRFVAKKRLSAKSNNTERMPSSFEYAQKNGQLHSSQALVGKGGGENAESNTSTTKRMKSAPNSVSSSSSECHVELDVIELDGFDPRVQHLIDTLGDVPHDGHCGYHCIAQFMGYTEPQGWKMVRLDVMKELTEHRELYTNIFRVFGLGEDGWNEIYRRANHLEPEVHSQEGWFCLPEMGFVVATVYNNIFVRLGPTEMHCSTFLPLRAPPSLDEKLQPICIDFVGGNHFVKVKLSEGVPIPPVDYRWHSFHYPTAKDWHPIFQRLCRGWYDLFPKQTPYGNLSSPED